MRDAVKQFIEENIDLIEDNRWEEIYEKAENKLKDYYTGRFTEIMLEADIHPENYLKQLPKYFLYASDIKEFIIPNNITSIGMSALNDCTHLTSMTIGDSVSTISDSAFSFCKSLKSVVLRNNVTKIGEWVFSNCTSLTSAEIGNSVTEISKRAFSCCTSLTNVTIGDSVTKINHCAFYGCTCLVHVTIPDSVTSIGEYAFANCGDNLTISYSGTKADWKKIYNPKAFKNTYFTVNCSDGKIVKKKR